MVSIGVWGLNDDVNGYTDDTEPWRRLASAILVRAIQDAKLNKKYKGEAIQWLRSEDAAFLMDSLNQDPEEVLRDLGIGVNDNEGDCNWGQWLHRS